MRRAGQMCQVRQVRCEANYGLSSRKLCAVSVSLAMQSLSVVKVSFPNS